MIKTLLVAAAVVHAVPARAITPAQAAEIQAANAALERSLESHDWSSVPPAARSASQAAVREAAAVTPLIYKEIERFVSISANCGSRSSCVAQEREIHASGMGIEEIRRRQALVFDAAEAWFKADPADAPGRAQRDRHIMIAIYNNQRMLLEMHYRARLAEVDVDALRRRFSPQAKAAARLEGRVSYLEGMARLARALAGERGRIEAIREQDPAAADFLKASLLAGLPPSE